MSVAQHKTENWKCFMHAYFKALFFFLMKFNFFTQLLVAGGLRVQHSCSFVSLLKQWVLASIEVTEENFCMQAPMPSSAHHMRLFFHVLLLPFPVDWLRPYVNPVFHLCSRGRTITASKKSFGITFCLIIVLLQTGLHRIIRVFLKCVRTHLVAKCFWQYSFSPD